MIALDLADRNPTPHSISSRLPPFTASITVAPPHLMKQSAHSESVPAIGASALMIMEITFAGRFRRIRRSAEARLQRIWEQPHSVEDVDEFGPGREKCRDGTDSRSSCTRRNSAAIRAS